MRTHLWILAFYGWEPAIAQHRRCGVLYFRPTAYALGIGIVLEKCSREWRIVVAATGAGTSAVRLSPAMGWSVQVDFAVQSVFILS
jgi:hypothetical protein